MDRPIACSPAFLDALASFDLAALERDPSVIYGLFPDLTLAYTNPAWRLFALENDGAEVLERYPLGTSVLAAMSGEALPFYEASLRSAMTSRTPWEHAYDCSTPDRLRWFRMRATPLWGKGLLIVHSLVVERPTATREHPPPAVDDAAYRNEHGMLVQCCCCRRTRVAGSERWDWVRAHVAACPPRTSHGICPLCIGYFYPSHHHQRRRVRR